MRKVILYSILLVAGLVLSQLLPSLGPGLADPLNHAIRVLTMIALAFIMIHVGYEFEIDKGNLREYGWDYVVAATAALFPWVFCAIYFVLVMGPAGAAGHFEAWKESLLLSRFASPTSAGVLFSMLAAAGLAATWMFRKLRVLAIFDDLDTILLMIPLKVMMVGLKWELAVMALFIAALLWVAWRFTHGLRLPITWPWVMAYAVGIALASEGIYLLTAWLRDVSPIHLEVLLPSFVIGCVMVRPAGQNPHRDDALEGHEEGPESPREQRVAAIVSACFMVLVGLSMPSILPGAFKPVENGAIVFSSANPFPGWGWIAGHVLLITLLSNLGKLFPALCYRREASRRERLALAIGMFPRGEVGAGVLVISLSYGIGGPVLTVALLSLALNLLLTGVFIIWVRRLLADTEGQPPPVPIAQGTFQTPEKA